MRGWAERRRSTTRDGLVAVYPSRARALVDAVYDWARFNSLPRGYPMDPRGTGQEAGRRRPISSRSTLRYGDVGTKRRVGRAAGARRCGGKASVRKLEKSLTPSSGLIPWIPTARKRGSIDRRWGVVVNGEA